MKKPAREVSRHLIRSYEAKALKRRSPSVRFADNLTSFFGSISFLIINAVLFTIWLLINTGKVPGIPIFDPYPFPMLTTAVSLEAIILTLIVLISQNRQSMISSLREEIDIQIDLAAEREITKILKLLNELLKAKGIKVDDAELEDMLKEVDASYIQRQLEKQLTHNHPKSFVKGVTKPLAKVGHGAEKKVDHTTEKKVEKVEKPTPPEHNKN
jgi:uncharacterized membrane protein